MDKYIIKIIEDLVKQRNSVKEQLNSIKFEVLERATPLLLDLMKSHILKGDQNAMIVGLDYLESVEYGIPKTSISEFKYEDVKVKHNEEEWAGLNVLVFTKKEDGWRDQAFSIPLKMLFDKNYIEIYKEKLNEARNNKLGIRKEEPIEE